MSQLLLASVLTFALTPLVIQIMMRSGVIDIPNLRSSHVVPVPRGGGVACLLGAFISILALSALGTSEAPLAALSAVGVLSLVGFGDDAFSVPIAARLVAQAVAGALIGLALGGGWLICLGLVGTLWIVNVVNFMDGINGIAGLSLALWGMTAFAVGQDGALPELATVGAVTAGVSLGFLPWNAPRARVFLGDAGSYLLGGLAATGLLLGWRGEAPMPLLIAPLYIFFLDTTTTLLKRIGRGDSAFQAHREHVYQRVAGVRAPAHMITSSLVVLMSAVITVSWASRALWVPVTVTILASATYLAAPRIIDRRRNRDATFTAEELA